MTGMLCLDDRRDDLRELELTLNVIASSTSLDMMSA